jgi:gliding motility-associated lipoprotein GldH
MTSIVLISKNKLENITRFLQKMLSFKKATTFLSLGILLIVIFEGCSRSLVFEDHHSITNASWKTEDTLKFRVNINDTVTPFTFYFNIRNTAKYGFSNLFLFVTTQYPNGNFSRDTVECWLAAPDGRWLGKGIGRLKDSEFVFRNNVRMPRNGTYIFCVNQAMRHSPLKGIADVGLRIEKPKIKD